VKQPQAGKIKRPRQRSDITENVAVFNRHKGSGVPGDRKIPEIFQVFT
jgi:hypothetical protein